MTVRTRKGTNPPMTFLFVLILCVVAALAVLGVLVFAAAAASRSKRKPPAEMPPHPTAPDAGSGSDAALTPAQETENPYRKLYK